jgi:hypothetical protein
MGNLRKTAFLKKGLDRLFKNEQEYLKNLIQALLSIQNSKVPQNDTHHENREGEQHGRPNRTI